MNGRLLVFSIEAMIILPGTVWCDQIDERTCVHREPWTIKSVNFRLLWELKANEARDNIMNIYLHWQPRESVVGHLYPSRWRPLLSPGASWGRRDRTGHHCPSRNSVRTSAPRSGLGSRHECRVLRGSHQRPVPAPRLPPPHKLKQIIFMYFYIGKWHNIIYEELIYKSS